MSEISKLAGESGYCYWRSHSLCKDQLCLCRCHVTMTKEEFIEQYTLERGQTYAEMQAAGREAKECRCGERDWCQGWQMTQPGVADLPS